MADTYEFLLDLRVDKDTVWKEYTGRSIRLNNINNPPIRNTEYSRFGNNGSIFLFGDASLNSNLALYSNEDFTLSVWSYMDQQYQGTDTNYIIWDDRTEGPRLTTSGQYNSQYGISVKFVASNQLHPVGKWTHIAITVNTTTKKNSIFVDGILKNQTNHHVSQSIKWSINYIGAKKVSSNGHVNTFVCIDDLCFVRGCVWTEDFTPPNKYLYDYLNPKGSYILSNLKTDLN